MHASACLMFVVVWLVLSKGSFAVAQSSAPPRESTRPTNFVELLIAGGQQFFPLPDPAPPAWWPQPDVQQQRASAILESWERSSAMIEHYRCSFRRWEYDPVWGPPIDPRTGLRPASRVSHGQITFDAPDKIRLGVQGIRHFTPGKAGEKPQYRVKGGESDEHYMFDSQGIYVVDRATHKRIEHPLTKVLPVKTVIDGPVSLLCSANAKKIRERYWVGVCTPANVKDEGWLELWPKLPEEARLYQTIELIIDEEEFLLKALQIHEHGGRAGDTPSVVFAFDDRHVSLKVPAENDSPPPPVVVAPREVVAPECRPIRRRWRR